MRANPFKIVPRTTPGVHPAQLFAPDPFLTAPGPENSQGGENGEKPPRTSGGPPQPSSRLQLPPPPPTPLCAPPRRPTTGSGRLFCFFRPREIVFGPQGRQKRIRGEKLRRMDLGRGPGTDFEPISVVGGGRKKHARRKKIHGERTSERCRVDWSVRAPGASGIDPGCKTASDGPREGSGDGF